MSKIENYNEYVKIITEELINEQAKTRKKAQNDVMDISPVLFCHIVKCLMFGRNCDSYEHWCREICGWIKGIDNITIRQNNKKIQYEDLKNWACDSWLSESEYANILETEMYTENLYNPVGFTELQKDYNGVVKLYKRLLKSVANGNFTEPTLKAELDQWINKHGIVESKED